MTINPIGTSAAVPGGPEAKKAAEGEHKGSFENMLTQAVSKVNDDVLKAQDVSTRMAAGEPVDIAHAMVGLTKAELSFKLMMQVRNRALTAYDDIMRMQF